MNGLTTIDLDIITAGGCEHPNCSKKHRHEPEMYVHSRCHVKAQMQVRYDSRDKMIHLECGVCNQPVAHIKVAEPEL